MSQDVSPAEASGTTTVAAPFEIKAFPRKPAVLVDPNKDAPFGWWPAIVIALVAFIDRVEVNLIAGALPQIQEHFGFSDAWAGAIPPPPQSRAPCWCSLRAVWLTAPRAWSPSPSWC